MSPLILQARDHVAWLAAFLFVIGCKGERSEEMTLINHLNPEGMHANPAFSQAVEVSGPHRTLYIGGQNAVDAEGNIVGKGDIKAQSEQAFDNLRKVLAAAGADLEHVVKWNVYVVQGQSALPGFEVFRKVWGDRGDPPAISVLYVVGLAHPDFLVEIDAIAVIPAP